MTLVRDMADSVACIPEVNPLQLSVRETSPSLDPRWESFVMQHPDATVYHHPAWLAALEREYGRPCVYLICEDSDGKLRGLFPLMFTAGFPFTAKFPLIGPRLASLPRTPLGGPLATDRRVTALLLQEAVRRASARRAVRLQIKAQGKDLSGLIDGVVAKPWRLTYQLHLSEKPGEPFRVSNRQNWARIKWSIHKAEANGLCIRRAGSEADLAAWYDSYLETMRRNIVPARPYRFFLALWELMEPKGLMQLLLAEQRNGGDSRIIGGHIYFIFGQTMTYAFGASRTRDLVLRPNDIILWRAINDAHRHGIRVVDLGEVPDGNYGLAQYKTKWGADPVRLFRYYYPDFASAEDSAGHAGSFIEILAKRVWRHLPLEVTSWLGDRVYARM